MPWQLSVHYPLNRKLGGPQNQSGYFGEVNNPLFLLQSEPQIIQPVA